MNVISRCSIISSCGLMLDIVLACNWSRPTLIQSSLGSDKSVYHALALNMISLSSSPRKVFNDGAPMNIGVNGRRKLPYYSFYRGIIISIVFFEMSMFFSEVFRLKHDIIVRIRQLSAC